ncbi:hypothetical protein OE88DRAFT_1735514 [Heliocybe sulcata]|uniref:Uncharacterized protein n=1 Tax=Heliocybe sulcata TaxID=5364 RepID=A0A5C3MZJ5_9AGAM|nr:hypothetical protein OE88DRAFT_1735514 [Heliocybe sulcata]
MALSNPPNQAWLTEALQVTELMWEDAAQPTYSLVNGDVYLASGHRGLRILDDIAMAVSTVEGKQIAVIISDGSRRDAMDLTFATLGSPSEDDRAAVDKFMALARSQPTSEALVLATIQGYASARIARLIDHAHKRLSSFDVMATDKTARFDWSCPPKPGEEPTGWKEPKEEFPRCFRGIVRNYGTQSSRDYMRMMLEDIKSEMAALGPLTPDRIANTSTDSLLSICFLANALVQSDYLRRRMMSGSATQTVGRYAILRYELARIARYHNALIRIVRWARVMEGRITYRWLSDGEGCKASAVQLRDSPFYVLQENLYRKSEDFKPEIEAVIRPWETCVLTFVHPELRLIQTAGDKALQILGTSESVCHCCRLWIEAHNRSSSTPWIFTEGRDHADKTWKYPDESPPEQEIVEAVKERKWRVFTVHNGPYSCAGTFHFAPLSLLF